MREYTSRQAIKLALKYKYQLGISRFSDISDFLPTGIKVVSATRISRIHGDQISSTQGKGMKRVEACCGALMEAIERDCCSNVEESKLIFSKYIENKCLNTKQLGYDLKGKSINWISVEDILNASESKLIPAKEIFFPYNFRDKNSVPIKANTSGVACGGNLEEAIHYALLEVIERYFTSSFYKGIDKVGIGYLVDLNSINDNLVKSTIEKLKLSGIKIFLFKINAIIPTYYTAVFDPNYLAPKFMISGKSASLDANKAIYDSILEAVQGLYVAINSVREDLDRNQDKMKYSLEEGSFRFERAQCYLYNKHGIRMHDNPKSGNFGNYKEANEHLLDLLREQGVEHVFCYRYEHPYPPFEVCRIVIPSFPDQFINERILTDV